MSRQVTIGLLLYLAGVVSQVAWAEQVVVGGGVVFSQAIPAEGDGEGWMAPVYLDVPAGGRIVDLDVYVDIVHPEVSDLIIYVDAPWGASVCLKDDALYQTLWQEVERADMRGTVFDDSASWSLTEGEAPYTGHFLPAQDEFLATFNGNEAGGVWTLRIYDIALKDAGVLEGWELHFDCEPVPEPVGALFLLAGGVFFACRRPCGRERSVGGALRRA